ncbi:hypothetical protein [Leisingera sp. M658]|uniref:hypothetical protein n=1 Tax=Leisingera sp. M658 TaxID=2867015 RepID=UPI0021A9289E|nr:hypothetical protein [Leisingera sp. M658]UWQ77444.1 hypothetical protein K3724_22970 [Leisingera sp. M658]
MKYLVIVSVVFGISEQEPVLKVRVLDSQEQCPSAARALLDQLDDPFAGTQRVSCRPLAEGA